MKIKYKTVDTSTLKGLEKAERLKNNGWTIFSVGLFIIKFYKQGEARRTNENCTHNTTASV